MRDLSQTTEKTRMVDQMVLIIGDLRSVASLVQTSDMLQGVIHQLGNITAHNIYQT